VGFITKGLSSASLIKTCQVEIDDDGDDKAFDSIEVIESGEFSSSSSCVTKNKKNKIVRLRIHLDGDKSSRYNRPP
jgi:hypothetical protein